MAETVCRFCIVRILLGEGLRTCRSAFAGRITAARNERPARLTRHTGSEATASPGTRGPIGWASGCAQQRAGGLAGADAFLNANVDNILPMALRPASAISATMQTANSSA